jgi:Rieske Fe-S protein
MESVRYEERGEPVTYLTRREEEVRAMRAGNREERGDAGTGKGRGSAG